MKPLLFVTVFILAHVALLTGYVLYTRWEAIYGAKRNRQWRLMVGGAGILLNACTFLFVVFVLHHLYGGGGQASLWVVLIGLPLWTGLVAGVQIFRSGFKR